MRSCVQRMGLVGHAGSGGAAVRSLGYQNRVVSILKILAPSLHFLAHPLAPGAELSRIICNLFLLLCTTDSERRLAVRRLRVLPDRRLVVGDSLPLK